MYEYVDGIGFALVIISLSLLVNCNIRWWPLTTHITPKHYKSVDGKYEDVFVVPGKRSRRGWHGRVSDPTVHFTWNSVQAIYLGINLQSYYVYYVRIILGNCCIIEYHLEHYYRTSLIR